MKAIILEDEIIAYRRLHRLLDELFPNEIEVVESFEAVKDLINYLNENKHPDILFLDIMVADGNSFELFDSVSVESKIIFTTAYDEFAVRAFRKSAIDYLLKPLKKDELKEAVEKVKKYDSGTGQSPQTDVEPYKERFLIRFGNKLYSVKTNEIAYIYSEEKLSFFIMHDGARVPSDIPLQNIQESLDPNVFFRANRQFIVHIDAIAKINRYSRSRINLFLTPDYKADIIISTENTPVFKKWMDR